MFELIPSKTMREYLKTQGREFTDFEKAALIRNAPNKTLSERIAALGELAEITLDELLKTRIAETGTALKDADSLCANLAGVYLDKSGEVGETYSAEIPAKKYADACRKLENAFENAETAEDILL